MQASVPEVMDISRESKETLEAYGAQPGQSSLANNCLLARRVVDALVPLVVASIGAVIAWWGWVLWIDGLHIKTAGANLPQSVNYLPLSLGGALMVVFALNRLWLALRPAAIEGDR